MSEVLLHLGQFPTSSEQKGFDIFRVWASGFRVKGSDAPMSLPHLRYLDRLPDSVLHTRGWKYGVED